MISALVAVLKWTERINIMPYIDSDFLKKKIFPYGMADNGNYGINAKSVMIAIENAPAVDAVPVVRCKDCKWFGRDIGYGKHDCKKYEMPYCLENDFCSYGERKCQNDI